MDRARRDGIAARWQRADVVNTTWGDYLREAKLPTAGRYALWVVYAFCGFETGGMRMGLDLERDDVHRGAYASNAVELVVR